MLTSLVLFLLILFLPSCQNGTSKPTNPFAQNGKTVPPPATFSSQESYLGQTPGNYIPQTPAVVYPSSGGAPPTQLTVPSSNVSLSEPANNNGDGATLFSATATGWTPVDVAATSQTAFQAMDAKVSATISNGSGMMKTDSVVPESLIVGTSHVVTMITDESEAANLTEPQLLLYSGKYEE